VVKCWNYFASQSTVFFDVISSQTSLNIFLSTQGFQSFQYTSLCLADKVLHQHKASSYKHIICCRSVPFARTVHGLSFFVLEMGSETFQIELQETSLELRCSQFLRECEFDVCVTVHHI
jgi:hypothetical protein